MTPEKIMKKKIIFKLTKEMWNLYLSRYNC